MKQLATMDHFAVFPYYFSERRLIHGPTLASVLQKIDCWRLDATGIRQYLDENPDDNHTCVEDVQRVPPNHILCEAAGTLLVREREISTFVTASLLDLLCTAMERKP